APSWTSGRRAASTPRCCSRRSGTRPQPASRSPRPRRPSWRRASTGAHAKPAPGPSATWSTGSVRWSARPSGHSGRRSIAEVLELEGDLEVPLAQGGDDLLQRVTALAGDPQLLALGLGLDALHAESLDEL